MMHSFASNPKPGEDSLDPDRLDQFLTYLRENRYQIISLDQYIESLLDGRSLNKCVVFTIDDGYRDFYLHGYDLFRKHAAPATVFLTSDFIDKRLFLWWNRIEFSLINCSHQSISLTNLNGCRFGLSTLTDRTEAIEKITNHCKTLANDARLTLIEELSRVTGVDISDQPTGKYEPLSWTEIEEMAQNGIDFYPHSQTHPIISQLTPDQKTTEIEQPKERIAEKLGTKADIFCYPNGQRGDFDDEVIKLLKRAGYKAAVTAIEGFDDTKSTVDMYRLKRFPIPTDLSRFKQYVSGLERFKRRFLNRTDSD